MLEPSAAYAVFALLCPIMLNVCRRICSRQTVSRSKPGDTATAYETIILFHALRKGYCRTSALLCVQLWLLTGTPMR